MTITEITPREAQRRMEASGAVLVDVREEHEREPGMAEGARGISRDELEQETELQFDDRDTELVLICQSGGRSMLAAGAMHRQGDRRRGSVRGGAVRWVSACF